jgi:hypothetical protein
VTCPFGAMAPFVQVTNGRPVENSKPQHIAVRAGTS